MPSARSGLAAGVIDTAIYAVGGQDSTGVYLASMYAFNPLTNSWIFRPSMPTPRSLLAAGVVNGVLYAVGGQNAVYPVLGTVEAYTP
jgi:N-acetylneuraminic acid mutarotase